jgi:hypothetical protein
VARLLLLARQNRLPGQPSARREKNKWQPDALNLAE